MSFEWNWSDLVSGVVMAIVGWFSNVFVSGRKKR